MGPLKSAFQEAKARKNTMLAKFAEDHTGFVTLGPIMNIVGVILIVIISVLILAALAPTFFEAVGNLTAAFLNADLGSPLANTIAGIVAILVPLALLFGFAFLVFRAAKFKGSGGY
jgi:hypothetical protein